MDFQAFFKDKSVKPRQKTETLAVGLLKGDLTLDELISYAWEAKDPEKATCLEAAEYATGKNPSMASEQLLDFASGLLNAKAPRVKWESARVIGNIAQRYPEKLDAAIAKLLINTEDKGTVVRWSAAFALGEILKLKTAHNKDLLPAVNAIMQREEKNSIKKIYQAAMKKSV